MKRDKKGKTTIVTAFSLKPENIAQVYQLAQDYEGNKSKAMQKAIERAWTERLVKGARHGE